jgi:hypothetical protein
MAFLKARVFMLIAVVALAGLLSFGSANVFVGNGNGHDRQERIISHTIGSVETIKQESPKPDEPKPLPAAFSEPR